ncbi:MAG: DNRLRE domain-containing protein [Kiritimatiellales bacterium]|nr:DNRLRE domain-containing protein [Kiritimatiellales bacterium]
MKHAKAISIWMAGLLVWGGQFLFADTISLGTTDDSWVNGNSPAGIGVNYGTLSSMRVRRDNDTWGNNYSMAKFDLSALPGNIRINNVRLRFYTGLTTWPAVPTNFSPVAIFNNTQDWNESTVVFSNAPAYTATPVATLDHFGLPGSEIYFTGTNTISAGAWLEYSDAATKALVQGWVVGSVPNYGVSIKATEFVDSGRLFSLQTKENAASGVRPMLVVTYTAKTNYTVWAGGWDVDIGAGTNDYDGDGLSNIYEFGLGGDPTNAFNQGTSPVFEVVDVGGSNVFSYVYPKLADPTSGLAYSLETSTDLVFGPWTNTGYSVTGINVTGGPLNFVTNTTDTVANKKFIRLIIK